MELWKSIPGTRGMIQISSEGRARSFLRGYPKILKTNEDGKGYSRLRVTIDRVKLSYKIHREVAKAFIDNPEGLPQVNHKDGNKSNNKVSNLEWVSNKENARHAIDNGLWDSVFAGAKLENEKRKKPVMACRIDGSMPDRHYESVSDAEKDIGSRHVSDVLKNKRTHAKGWRFYYEKEVTANDNP